MKRVYNINAEAFIIPNSLEFNKKTGEVEVQLWFVAPTETDDCYESDNICDHGVILKDGSEDGLWVRPNAYFQMVPIKNFIGKKEGDVVIIDAPVSADRKNPGNEDAILRMECTLNQKSYRYRRFGTFDEVLDKLIQNFR